MKTLYLVLALGLFSTALGAPSAYADNYLCKTHDSALMVAVTHTIVPMADIRLESALEIINPTADANNQVLASFSPVDEILVTGGAEYLVRPTTSLSNPQAANVYLGDTPLNELASIELHIDASNTQQLLDPAILTLQRLNGSEVQTRMVCARK